MTNPLLALVPFALEATKTVAKNMDKPIYVTQPALPLLKEFIPYLKEIWANKILTNGDPFHPQLKKALCDYLDVMHVAVGSGSVILFGLILKAGVNVGAPSLVSRNCETFGIYVGNRARQVKERKGNLLGRQPQLIAVKAR